MRTKRVAELDLDDVTAAIAGLAAAGYKRKTIKKSRDALAMVLDHHGVDPNPVRDKRVRPGRRDFRPLRHESETRTVRVSRPLHVPAGTRPRSFRSSRPPRVRVRA